MKKEKSIKKEVYIVHCVDTEGPMYESLDSTFNRVKSVFGFDIEANHYNLNLLQNKKIDLNGKEEAVKNLISPERINMNETWRDVDQMLDEITSDKFRNRVTDSSDNGWVYTWFCLDHVGFTGENPRRRDAGHHNIFDHYSARLKANPSRDQIQWHYHPLPVNGNYNASGVAYLNSSNIWEVLSRKIIDRKWFPSVYRPGFHCERPDSHWFLEQWIPFDFANQSMRGKSNEIDQPDLSKGRWGDWREASIKWSAYHPSHDNYQLPGDCRRWIFRCLNMEARLREITEEDVRDGFKQAQQGEKTCISFTNHDFRDMGPEINKVRSMIDVVSKEMPDVKYYFVDALTAARKMLDLKIIIPDMKINVVKTNKTMVLSVKSMGELFGVQPYLAIKTKDGRYLWENFDKQSDKEWSFVFDEFHIPANCVEEIGVASNSTSGNTQIVIYNVDSDLLSTYDL
mgnify:FL=1|jgi:hypothetical protein